MILQKKIKTATSNKDWATVKINAHKMLSSVRIFEMQEIISILEKIEIESEGEKNAYIIEQDVEKLSGLVERVIYDVKIGLNKIKTSE